MAEPGELHLRRYPQSKCLDAVRWLPSASAFDRLVAVAVHDPDPDPDADADAAAFALEIHSLSPALASSPSNPSPPLRLRSSWPSPSRIAALRASHLPHNPLAAAAAASTLGGSLHLLLVDLVSGAVDTELSIVGDRSFHAGPIAGLDVQVGGGECVTAGEDGRVNVVGVGEGRAEHRRVHDSSGLASYTAARWGSPAEFATGGAGFGVRWWDQRKPEGLVAQFKGSW